MTTLPFIQDMTKDLDNLRSLLCGTGNIETLMRMPDFRQAVDEYLDALSQSWTDAQNASDAEARRKRIGLKVVK